MGYLVPGRDGPGVWPDGRVVGRRRRSRRHLEIDTLNIVSWPECRPELSHDASGDDGGNDAPTTLPSGQTASP